MAKKTKNGRTFTTRGISIHPDTLERAVARCKSLNMGWSFYITQLIENDLRTEGTFVITPRSR